MNQHSKSRLIFVSGGSRSGKSRYAEMRATALPGQRTYIATCPVIDDEMEQRIACHRQERAGQEWITIEEPVALVQALRNCHESSVVLVDCLTLWMVKPLFQSKRLNFSRTDGRTHRHIRGTAPPMAQTQSASLASLHFLSEQIKPSAY